MREKILSCVLLAAFCFAALFGFTACGGDQDIAERMDALAADVLSLKTKMEALEAANANFRQQLAALDESSETFADDLAAITSDYNSLTADLQNAKNIERTVINKDNAATDSVIEGVDASTALSKNGENVSVGVTLYYNVDSFPYHLAVCKVRLTYDGNSYEYGVPLVLENGNHGGEVSGNYTADIKPANIGDVTAEWTELVLYKFN